MSSLGVQIALCVFSWITFAVACFALFSPLCFTFGDAIRDDLYKNYRYEPRTSYGQLRACVYRSNQRHCRDCEWLIDNNVVRLGYTKHKLDLPAELKVSQALCGFGTALFLLEGVLTVFALAMKWRKRLKIYIILIGILAGKCFVEKFLVLTWFLEDRKLQFVLSDRL